MTTQSDIDRLAARYGLAPQDLAALLIETDASRGMLGPEDLSKALSLVTAAFIGSMQAAAERASPVNRPLIDSFVAEVIGLLAAQLQAAGSPVPSN